jgi:hypothetical protein
MNTTEENNKNYHIESSAYVLLWNFDIRITTVCDKDGLEYCIYK